MNIEKTWIWGGAGLFFGLLLGVAIAGDGREAREFAQRGQEEMSRNVASLSESVGRINDSLTELGGRVAGIETSVGQVSEQQAGVQGLAARIEEVGTELDGAVAQLGGAVAEVGSKVTESLGERMDGLRAALAGAGSRVADSVRGSTEGSDATATAAAPAGAGAGDVVPMGGAVGFGDGAARVFLSGVDPEAGTARVAINGPVASVVSVGEPVEAGACSVTLTGFTDTGATFTADCGGEAAATEAAATESAATAVGSGAGVAVAVGAAQRLADGKLMVFLSAIDAEAGTARVAVNGPKAISLAMGEPVEAGGCTVTLTGIGEGEATIDGAC